MPPADNAPFWLQFQYWDKTNAEYKQIADAWIAYYQNCSRHYGELARRDAIKQNFKFKNKK
tara:strand:- start:327 stop:509 length:183 start_codon:yes stop_codon:yes gene_type:complete